MYNDILLYNYSNSDEEPQSNLDDCADMIKNSKRDDNEFEKCINYE